MWLLPEVANEFGERGQWPWDCGRQVIYGKEGSEVFKEMASGGKR